MAWAMVTGASSGVGRAIASSLADAGWRVLALGRDAGRMRAVGDHPGITSALLDITDRNGLAGLVADHPIGLLVNNAGIMPPLCPFQETEPADLDMAIAVNLTAQIALTRMVVPGMIARGRGHVFFTGSTAGHAAVRNMAAYAASKAGLGAFAQSLRLDLSPHGIRVTEIVAGRIETGLYRGILPDEARASLYDGGTAIQPADIAQMVLAVLALPENADVARFDILPTRPQRPIEQKK